MIVLLGITGQVSAQSVKAPANAQVLFSVHGRNVSTAEFEYLYRKNHPKKEDYTEARINAYLDLLITFKSKVAEAEARGYDTTAAFWKEFRSYRSELIKPYVADKNDLDRLTRQAYDRLIVEVRASHILVAMNADATPADTLQAYNKLAALRARIMQGEEFGKLAREFSEDPGAKTNSGDLGYFSVMQMVYLFEEAAYNLKTGEVSKPVRTSFGYHLIKVTDRRLALGEVEVSHILLSKGTGDDKKVKNKIFEIYEQLQGGRSWDELCREFSDDQATRNNGGKLRPFGVGTLARIPEFEAMAFSLHVPGEISDPFQSNYGWHIIRLERRIPIPPFEQMQETLKRRVTRDERLELAEKKAFVEKRNAFQYSEQPEVKALVFQLADSTLPKGKWTYRGNPELLNRTLFSLRDENYTVAPFTTFLSREQPRKGMTPNAIMTLCYDMFVKQTLEDMESNDLTKSNSDYRNLIQEYREGILLFTIMEKEVWNKAAADSAGLRAFYNKHIDRYKAGERVKARVFSTDDSLFLERMREKVSRGDSLTRMDMRNFKTVQPPRNYQAGESKAVDRVPKSIGLHFTAVNGTSYMIQIDNLVPAGTRSLEEARSQVISDYQDSLEKEWVTNLRKKYPVKINGKGKKFVLRELTQS